VSADPFLADISPTTGLSISSALTTEVSMLTKEVTTGASFSRFKQLIRF